VSRMETQSSGSPVRGTRGRRAAGIGVGDLVEVRAEREILATLDECGELDGLPFMPEMLQFCGRRFVVDKVASKACDTISWTGLHRMNDAVHLAGVRCDGAAHGGCQAGCLVYWKTVWLKKAEPAEDHSGADPAGQPGPSRRPVPVGSREDLSILACSVATLRTVAGKADASTASSRTVYSCQATELLRAAPERIPIWDLRQYVADVRSGNARVSTVTRGVVVGLFNRAQRWAARRLPRRLLIRGGRTYPFIEGRAVEGRVKDSLTERLDLLPGEWVRVKSREQIEATLTADNRNRGLTFDVEMLKYCGRTARVLRRVEHIINEQNGEMMHLKKPCLILEDVICTSDYHRSCPRGIYPYWREIWLERVPAP
jgi:hypothetical protein